MKNKKFVEFCNMDNKVIKGSIIFFVCIFIVLVCSGVNMTNVRAYNNHIPKNIEASNTLSLGKERPIRSDEWMVNNGSYFYELNNLKKECDIKDIVIRIVDIPKWFYGILPKENAYSFQTLIMYLILYVACVCFFRIFEKNNWIVIVSALIFVFQPGIAWWNSAGIYAIFFSIIDLFYYFFILRRPLYKIGCCVGLIICVGYYLVHAYPAWMVPLFYLAIMMIIGLFLQEKGAKLEKKDLIYIISTIFVMALVFICYYVKEYDFIEAVSKTVYPSNRSCPGGGVDLKYLGEYLMMVLEPFKDVPSSPFLNNCETSTFLSFFPVPWILYIVNFKELKEKKIVGILLAFSAIVFIYSKVGFGETLAKLTFWEMTTNGRAVVIGDFSMSIALVLEAYYFFEKEKQDSNNKKSVIVNVVVVLFLLYIPIRQSEIVIYLGWKIYLLMSLAVLLVANLIQLGKRDAALIIVLAISIISGAFVNPINLGTGIIDNTPLSKAIIKINEENPGNWITNDDMAMAKYVQAQGVECLNALNYPPNYELYAPIDKDGKNEDVYNRYAHVMFHVTDQRSVKFNLIQQDYFEVYINSETLKWWGVKYIVSRTPISINKDIASVKMKYKDLDGYNIYEIKYK